MPDTKTEALSLHSENATRYMSFLLSCYRSPGGDIRIRLTNVQTGQKFTLAELKAIPNLIERLITDFDE